MHHPPFPIALAHLDQYGIVESEGIARVLSRYRNIQHILFGHVHRPVSGSWRGIPFSALRGTNHQNWLDFKATRINISSLEPPAHAVIFVSAEQTIVHFHDYLDQSPKFAHDPDAPQDQQIRRL